MMSYTKVPLTAEVMEIMQWLHSNEGEQKDHSAIAQYYEALTGMNHPHRLHVGKGFCYAAERHEPARCSMHPAEQGMSTIPLSHWLTFGNTFLKIFAAPFMSAFVIVPS